MKEKRIIRPKKGRILFGVAAGIANYFDIDPTIIRLIFVLLAFGGGAGVLLYVIGIFIIPSEENVGEDDNLENRVHTVAHEIKDTAHSHRKSLEGRQFLGIILILIGLIFLAQMFAPWFGFSRLWPLIIIIIGLAILISRKRSDK